MKTQLGLICLVVAACAQVSMAQQGETPQRQSDLREGHSYRLAKTVLLDPVADGCQSNPAGQKFAGEGSKFEVVVKLQGCDIVRFWSINGADEMEGRQRVIHSEEYVLPQSISGVPIEASTTKSGKSSGLLVLPYKLRNDDGSVTGDATVGYYAGWDTRAGTILFSAGLSQVSLPVSATETENQSAITVAVGYLIKNWGGVDMGVVLGIDHIGGDKGDDWQYEDDPWLSLMIGWNFSQ